MLPAGFTYLEDPRIIYSLDYATHHNFMGRPVAGYLSSRCILTEKAAKVLISIQDELDTFHKGYRLKIFDAYRPATAVQDFKNWAMDLTQQEMKEIFYPNVQKSELFKLGYVAENSSHSRGSTVDLTITVATDSRTTSHRDLEMSTIFDFFDKKSHTAAPNIPDIAKKNRFFLKNIMEKHGFLNYPLEWWHFTLKNEPFPETYFDFPVR